MNDCELHDREIFANLSLWMMYNYPWPRLEINQSYENVQLVQVSCWKTINGETSVCPDTGCCGQKVSIYRTSNGLDIQYDWSFYEAVDCDDDGGVTCSNLCNWALYYYPFPKKSIEEEPEAPFERKSFVKPNPTNGETELSLNFEETGIIDIKIVNNRGSLMKAARYNKTSQEAVYDLNIDDFPSGLYYYMVQYNGRQITNGTFSVVK